MIVNNFEHVTKSQFDPSLFECWQISESKKLFI